MGGRNRGNAAVVDDSRQVSALVVSGADVSVLNAAIVGLANAAPGEKHARMLYDRWARFSASPARQRPDVELEPVLRAFAITYRAVAKGRDVEPRIVELAGEPVGIEVAGKQLDAALQRVGQASTSSTSSGGWLKHPLVLIGGGLLAYKFLGKKGKRR